MQPLILNSRPSDHNVDASFPSSIDRLSPNSSMGLFLDRDAPFPPLVWIVVLCICLPHVYNYLRAPLKAIPGPWRSRIAPLHERPGRRVRGKHLLQLHQQYGKSSFVLPFMCPQALLCASARSSSLFKALRPSKRSTDSRQNGQSLRNAFRCRSTAMASRGTQQTFGRCLCRAFRPRPLKHSSM